ncbi:MAG TPA: type II secretion system protein [Candidatus Omnitrophota bacterium]|nr:type II secretion system protein [Candidatus Omnitrophota bacterium]
MQFFYKIKQKKGLTLTELLVSTVLVGIVLIGVVSFNFAISQIERSSSKATILALETAAVMSQIVKDASLAVGFSADPGIINPNSTEIGFRQDVNGTPENYADDQWISYTRYDKYLGICPEAPPVVSCFTPPVGPYISNKIFAVSFSLEQDKVAKTFYIDISLATIYDPAKAYDPITNPSVKMDARVSPKGHGW